MKTTRMLLVLAALTVCGACAARAQDRQTTAKLEDYLSTGRKAARPKGAPATRPVVVAAPAATGEAPAKPSEVGALRTALQGNMDELLEGADTLYSEALAQLTNGPELAALQTGESHLRTKIAQLEIYCDDVRDRIDRERGALQDSLASIAKIYKPGTSEYKAEVAKLVDRRKPRLDLLVKTATNYPQTAEALKDQLAKTVTDREYLELVMADMSKPSNSIAAIMLAGAFSSGTGTATTRPAEDIERDYKQATQWLGQMGVSQGGPAPAPKRQPLAAGQNEPGGKPAAKKD